MRGLIERFSAVQLENVSLKLFNNVSLPAEYANFENSRKNFERAGNRNYLLTVSGLGREGLRYSMKEMIELKFASCKL